MVATCRNFELVDPKRLQHIDSLFYSLPVSLDCSYSQGNTLTTMNRFMTYEATALPTQCLFLELLL